MSETHELHDLYDTEILAAEKVLETLGRKQRTSQNLESFRREILDRFAEIGLVVKAKVYDTSQEGVFAFEVEIQGRTEVEAWDYDRQRHEIINDPLELLPPSERGQTIKTDMPPGSTPKHKH